MTRVAVATHGDVERLMRRPYHRTLWTFLQLQEHERMDALKDRARLLNMAGLLAIAFHEPAKLKDEHHALMKDSGMLPTDDEAIANAQSVIDAMKLIDAGRHPTTTLGAPDGN